MARKVIGVDIGGTYLRVALVKNDKTFNYIKKRTPKNKKKLLKELTTSIESLNSWRVRGIGVSCAGPLENGVIKNPPNLPFKNFDLKKYLKIRFKKKVEVENDAKCVALAESKFGCRKKNFIILTFGTGVGGGIIIDNKLYRGSNYAGELGHIIVDNGKSLEDLWKLHRTESKKYFGKSLMIKELLKRNDKNSRKIINDTTKYIAQGIASLIHVFDPEIIVLAGGIRETGNAFLNKIRKKIGNYLIIPREPKIVWSRIDHPGIVGAGMLV